MFEDIVFELPQRSIPLATRKGTNIRNGVAPEPDESGINKYKLTRKRYGQQWINRKAATGVYNCFGMVFASRRTSLYEEDEITVILEDDDYRRIGQADAMVGDLAFYIVDPDGRRIVYHVAQIIRVGKLKELWALSKWNDCSGEDVHHIMHHCWEEDDIVIEIWTDR